MVAESKPNEIYITRIYDASVEQVWAAWTDPAQVALWWGPRGFTLTTHSKDLRPGGTWVYTMHGPDGTDYPNKTYYYEVEENSLLVYDHGANDDRPALFRVTVKFTNLKGKTKMEMTMALATAEAAQEAKKFIKKAGGNSTWDRLAEYLEKETHSKEIFVINRTFDAPINTIFEMWTNPDHLSQWLPPTGFTMESLRADIRAGGTSLFSMSDGSQTRFFGRLHHLKIDRPDCLVYTQQFCDERENIVRNPFDPTFPETLHTTVLFVSEGPQQTRATLRWNIDENLTAAEIKSFTDERAGMTVGWSGSFDKLDELLLQGAAAT
jgi:uncharacterized protein YndB with AHSA1/START domain